MTDPDADYPWRLETAAWRITKHGAESSLPDVFTHVERALEPVEPGWLARRLPLMWVMFMPMRDADPRAKAIWLSETTRLLSDIPQDIVEYAIDEAIRENKTGFMPSVGQIRAIAAPLLDERKAILKRLDLLMVAVEDGPAQRERQRHIEGNAIFDALQERARHG